MRSHLLLSALVALVAISASPVSAAGSDPVLFYSIQSTVNASAVQLYGLAPPNNMGDADINITVAIGVADPSVNVYCNPMYGQYRLDNATRPSNYPQPGFAIWQSNTTDQVASLYISVNDPGYKLVDQYPSFTCAVINSDTKTAVPYNLTAIAIPPASTLISLQQTALGNLYSSCCSKTGSCAPWRNLSSSNLATTNFCTVLNQSCTAAGQLRTLDMGGFNLVCTWSQISTSVAILSSLVTLDLSNNPGLSGEVDDVFQVAMNMPNLTTLQLTNNTGLRGPLLPANAEPITTATCALSTASLENLLLANMSLGGTLPDCLASSSTFVALDVVGNQLTGSIPNTFTTATRLTSFLGYGNNFTGSIPASLGSARSLVTLDLSGNFLNGSVPGSLVNATELQDFILRDNLLSGTLPAFLAQSGNMRNIDLKNNRFSALEAPYVTGAGMSTNTSLLNNFRVSFNNINSPFPAGLSGFASLEFLILNVNNFSGTLPAYTSMFPALRALNASLNKITGPIPSQWGNTGLFKLPALILGNGQAMSHVFNVSNNALTGAVPNFLNKVNLMNYQSQGVALAGNAFSNACTPQLSYVYNICNGNRAADTAGTSPPASPSPATVSPAVPGPPTAVQSVATPTTPASQTPTQVTTEGGNSPVAAQNGSGGLNSGAIAGIAVGSVCAVALVAGLLVLLVKRRPGANVQPSGDAMTSELGRRGSLAARLKTAGSSGLGGLPSRLSLPTRDSAASSGKFERFQDGQ